ncbi:hypothetical protein MTP99_006905 [Tenebrio molitor]|nr:hypothetical protein MTP99_006905 [Tenebrio molitor]
MTASLTPKEQEDSFSFMMNTEEHMQQAEGKLKFVLNSAATEHLINDLSFYKEYQQLEKPIKISVAKKEACVWATLKS